MFPHAPFNPPVKVGDLVGAEEFLNLPAGSIAQDPDWPFIVYVVEIRRKKALATGMPGFFGMEAIDNDHNIKARVVQIGFPS